MACLQKNNCFIKSRISKASANQDYSNIDYLKGKYENNSATNGKKKNDKKSKSGKEKHWYFRKQTKIIAHVWTWLRRGNLKRETESVPRVAQ